MNLDIQHLLLTVRCSRDGAFAARAVLADGSLREFASPFELARFVAALARALPAPQGPADTAPPPAGLR